MNNYIFKIGTLLLVFPALLCVLSCSSLKGKYCYNTQSTSECIDFKKDHTFEYNYWIDTGSDKGIGDYEIVNDEVVLTFKKPSVKNTPRIEIKQLGYDETEDTVGRKNDVVYYDNQNFVKIICQDKGSKEKITFGGISYYSFNGINLGKAEYFGSDTIKVNTKNLDFPLTLKFEFPGYLDHELTLDKKVQYFILAELVSNQGYNVTSGQKRYSKSDFLKKRPDSYPSLQEKKFVKQK